ncbi:MAG: hypothetical protein OEZ59_06570 [Deltaproteobacteria bacterium]|nr:hypothetical protein [Deltaproteobacteria bacterium]
MRFIVIVLGLFAVAGLSFAENQNDSHQIEAGSLLELRGSGIVYPAQNIDYLEDPEQVLNIVSVSSPEMEAAFSPLAGSSIAFGISRSAFWLRLRLHKHTPQAWVLDAGYPQVDLLQAYYKEAGEWKLLETGDSLPFQRRAMNLSQASIPLDMPPGEHTLYIRVVSESSLTLPILLYPDDLFFQRKTTELLVVGGTLGMILIISLLIIMLIKDEKRELKLSYSFFVISFTLYSIMLNGFGHIYIWPNVPQANNPAFLLGIYSTCFFLLHLFYTLFEGQHPWLFVDITRKLVMLLALAGIIMIPFMEARLLFQYVHLLYPVGLGTGLLMAINAWRRGLTVGMHTTISLVATLVVSIVLWMASSGIPILKYSPNYIIQAVGSFLLVSVSITIIYNRSYFFSGNSPIAQQPESASQPDLLTDPAPEAGTTEHSPTDIGPSAQNGNGRARLEIPDIPRQAWRISTLGDFKITHPSGDQTVFNKITAKQIELLKHLITLGGENVPVIKIQDLIWPDLDGDKASGAFATTIYRLRKSLGAKTLEVKGGMVSLNHKLVWVDLLNFRQAIANDSARDLEDGLLLYRGDYMPGYEHPEVERMRENLFISFKNNCVKASEELLNEGLLNRALMLLEHGLNHAPHYEPLIISFVQTCMKQNLTSKARDRLEIYLNENRRQRKELSSEIRFLARRLNLHLPAAI